MSAEYSPYTKAKSYKEFLSKFKAEITNSEDFDEPYMKKINIILRYAYRLGNRANKNAKLLDHLKRDLNKLDIAIRGKTDANSYVGAIRLLANKSTHTISKSQIYKYADSLNYAAKHKVPAQWLIGFVYQAGGYDILDQKIKGNRMELWIKDEIRFESINKDEDEDE